MRLIEAIAVTITIIVFSVDSKRILIITPTASLSHNLFFRPIIRELSLRGHDVVSVTADPIKDKKLTNLTEIDIHDIAYKLIDIQMILKAFHSMSTIDIMRAFAKSSIPIQTNVITHPEVQEMLNNKNEHFDLVIVELVCYSALAGFKAHFKTPLVGMLSLDLFQQTMDYLGNPPNPSYFAGPFKLSGRLNFWERLRNFWYVWHYRVWWYTEYIPMQNALLQKHFGHLPKSEQDAVKLEKNIDLVLVNTNPVFHVPRPTVQNIIPIGGLHQREHVSLPQDLQKYLDQSTQGFIYFSLGSNIKSNTLPPAQMKALLDVFKSLPFNVLWKFEDDKLIGKPVNVRIEKWTPQQDILDHPNIKLFITQGGIQSIEEAIVSKVPLIGMPVGLDQDYQVHRVVELELGKCVSFETFTASTLRDSIMEVVFNITYKQNMIKMSSLLHDQENKPLDRAIWWIEYVLRHGGAQHLRSPGADLPWHQYLLLDVIAFLLVCSLLLLAVIVSILRFIIKYFRNKKAKND